MKNYIILALFIAFAFPQKSKEQQKNLDTIEKIVAYNSKLYIESPFRITCDNFFAWADKIDTNFIFDVQHKREILEAIHHAKPAPKYKVDTRSRVFIYYYSGKIDSLCLGGTSIFSLNGNSMDAIDRNLILSIYKKDPNYSSLDSAHLNMAALPDIIIERKKNEQKAK